LVEIERISEEEIETITSIWGGDSGNIPYYSWMRGERDKGLYPYANNTIFSDTQLHLFKGYPVKENQAFGEKTSRGSLSFLIESQFTPGIIDATTVCHITLPKGFIPRRDMKPLVQPYPPYAKLQNGRFILTWPITGAFDIRFCITPLMKDESLEDFDQNSILCPLDKSSPKIGVEVNLGVIKFKFGN